MSADAGVVDEVCVELPQDARAPSVARRVVGATLERWGLTPLLDRALLVVSELSANAVRHGVPPVRLLLQRYDSRLRLALHDHDSTPPTLAPDEVSTDATSGRGMLLVSASADDNGVTEYPGDGKDVWADIRTP
jgi:anti-sigma regulatory factor (Ser/Thr protein kinase)